MKVRRENGGRYSSVSFGCYMVRVRHLWDSNHILLHLQNNMFLFDVNGFDDVASCCISATLMQSLMNACKNQIIVRRLLGEHVFSSLFPLGMQRSLMVVLGAELGRSSCYLGSKIVELGVSKSVCKKQECF